MKNKKFLIWLDHSYLAKRSLYNKLSQNAHYAKGDLLDVGCGEKPYAELFKPHVKKYVGLDFKKTAGKRLKRADIIGDALSLPFADNTFDTVLSTEVLEHVTDPQRMLSEIFRVLKHNGNLILTTPLFWPLHEEPHDYYRYTPYGLKHLAIKAGLKIIKIDKTTGAFSSLGQILSYELFSQYGAKKNLIIKTLVILLCLLILAFCSSLNYLNRNKGSSLDYILIARKRSLK